MYKFLCLANRNIDVMMEQSRVSPSYFHMSTKKLNLTDYSMTLNVLFEQEMKNLRKSLLRRGIQMKISVFGVNTEQTFLRMNNVK